MTAINQSEPSRVGNPKNEKFRSLEEMDQDVFFHLGRRIIDWIQATTGGENSHHFGIREPQQDKNGIKSGKAALRSLLLVSRKFNSIWTPISIQNVTLYTNQLPSFLRLLLRHPELGSEIRTLNFIRREPGDVTSTAGIASKLVTLQHPELVKLKVDQPLYPRSVRLLVELARSLIIQQCSNLRGFTFGAGIVLPLSSEKSHRFIFSERLKSIRMVEHDQVDAGTWTLRQALALVMFFPSLQSMSLVVDFDHEDAQVINTHLTPLVKSKKAVSKVKNLYLRVHQHLPEKKHQHFDYDSTFSTFLSLFNHLENITLIFQEDPWFRDRNIPRSDRMSRISECPTVDVIRGLRSSFSTIKSLSLEGQYPFHSEHRKKEDVEQRFQDCLMGMTNLDHVRIDFAALMYLMFRKGGESPLKFQALEMAESYSRQNRQAGRIEHFEAILARAIQLKILSGALNLFRTPKEPICSVNEENPRECEYDESRWKEALRSLLTAANDAGVKVEFV